MSWCEPGPSCPQLSPPLLLQRPQSTFAACLLDCATLFSQAFPVGESCRNCVGDFCPLLVALPVWPQSGLAGGQEDLSRGSRPVWGTATHKRHLISLNLRLSLRYIYKHLRCLSWESVQGDVLCAQSHVWHFRKGAGRYYIQTDLGDLWKLMSTNVLRVWPGHSIIHTDHVCRGRSPQTWLALEGPQMVNLLSTRGRRDSEEGKEKKLKWGPRL